MARRKTRVTINTAPSKKETVHTASEMKEWYAQQQKRLKQALQLTDFSKAQTSTSSVYSKEELRTYIKNIGAYESRLRKLSWYLYNRSIAYKRWVIYNATMFCLDARYITGAKNYNLTKSNNDTKLLKNFNETVDIVDRMNLKNAFYPIFITCFVQDVFYGVKYFDDTGLFILPLPADYCRIAGRYFQGDLMFAMNMSYFQNRQELLQFWGEPFKTMYKEYLKDQTNNLWQLMPDEYACCFKFGSEDYQTVIPPALPGFNSLISLSDLEDIQATADKQDIFKLIYYPIPLINGSKNPDDYAVDIDFASEYFEKIAKNALPDYVTAVMVPGADLKSISFSDTDRVNDTNKLSKATKTFFNSIGGGQVLNAGDVSGTEGLKAVIRSDTQYAISSLLPQVEAWVNRMLSYEGQNLCKVKFFPVSIYTVDWFKESLLKSGEYGVSTSVLAMNTLNGFSEKDTLYLAHLENDILHLENKIKPLSSSHTQSDNNKLNPQKDETNNVPTKEDIEGK